MHTRERHFEDIVKGFNYGADDYIPKPFSPRVLMARIRAVLKRGSSNLEQDEREFVFQDFRLDSSRRRFFIGCNEVNLTFSEFQIMELVPL